MIQEEIEKAANQISFIETTDERERFLLRSGFKAGAKWRVDASWHGAKETPQERRFCLYILKDGSYGCGYYHKRDNTIFYEQFEKVDKWAYFNDLIPFLED